MKNNSDKAILDRLHYHCKKVNILDDSIEALDDAILVVRLPSNVFPERKVLILKSLKEKLVKDYQKEYLKYKHFKEIAKERGILDNESLHKDNILKSR